MDINYARIPMKRLMALSVAVGALVVSGPLFAHHGNSAFDGNHRLALKGTVTEWYWANPHCVLQFDVTDDKGQVVHWAAETSNPSDMANRSWGKMTLKPGDQVTVTLEPAKNGKPVGRVLAVVLPSGQKLSGGFGSLERSVGVPNEGATNGPKSDDSGKK
jgi:hypothetical protein